MRRYRIVEAGNECLVTEEPASLNEALELARKNFDPRPYQRGPWESTIWVDLLVREEVWDDETGTWRQVAEARRLETVFPPEPPCLPDRQHDWRLFRTIGHWPGNVYEDICVHCGRYQVTDTWARNPADGTRGLVSTEYREADEASMEWISKRKEERSDV